MKSFKGQDTNSLVLKTVLTVAALSAFSGNVIAQTASSKTDSFVNGKIASKQRTGWTSVIVTLNGGMTTDNVKL